MKQVTDFSKYMAIFFTKHLPDRKGASPNTVKSYRDCFVLLFNYMESEHAVKPEKIYLKTIQRSHIEGFLDWLESSKGCTISTRNVRLAAIHSFYRFMQYEMPDRLEQWQEILTIPQKKPKAGTMNYTSIDGIKLLLEMPDKKSPQGLRDLALLSLMYDSGARVQEIADLKVSMVRLSSPSVVKLSGKGGKTRIVPMMKEQISLLELYMKKSGLLRPEKQEHYLFTNRQGTKLTRAGIGYILQKYVLEAHKKEPLLIPEKFSCHCLRHSKAMHMLQAGVNLVYIRDFLGHTSIQTTEIYARADSKQKRDAIEKAYSEVLPAEESVWENNKDVLDWLKQL
ncbi:MAG: site-specific integrase [Lachnospiraceae bacterium]|nr:site-specific integrase [Lachnospiraceae bacterium]